MTVNSEMRAGDNTRYVTVLLVTLHTINKITDSAVVLFELQSLKPFLPCFCRFTLEEPGELSQYSD